MAKILAPQMVSRLEGNSKLKSAIVITSSGLGSIPIAGWAAYSSAKSFASFLGQCLNFELEGKIDVMSYQAGEVATKLLGKFKTDMRTITPDTAAKSCLRDLGIHPLSNGSGKHEVAMYFLGLPPLRYIQNIMFKKSLKSMQRALKKQREDNKQEIEAGKN